MVKYCMKTNWFLALVLATGLLCACSKEKKTEESSEPQTESAEDIERSYKDQIKDALPSSEVVDKAVEAIDHLELVKDQDEMKIAVEGLRQDVVILQDLLKKYRATGEEKFKQQAMTIALKAREIQKKIREAGVVPEGKQMTEAGDLFGELEKAWAELQ